MGRSRSIRILYEDPHGQHLSVLICLSSACFLSISSLKKNIPIGNSPAGIVGEGRRARRVVCLLLNGEMLQQVLPGSDWPSRVFHSAPCSEWTCRWWSPGSWEEARWSPIPCPSRSRCSVAISADSPTRAAAPSITRTLSSMPLTASTGELTPGSCDALHLNAISLRLRRFDASSLMVVAGEHSLLNESGFEQRRLVRNITIHPGYDRDTVENDISVLEVSHSFFSHSWARLDRAEPDPIPPD